MPMTKAQEKHVKTFGKDRFHRVLVAANLTVLADPRLTGANKIRREISQQAALEATGYERAPLILSAFCGTPTRAVEIIAQEAFDKAFAAASEIARGV
jgi:hypothetical protein